jgi:hypothetical protein
VGANSPFADQSVQAYNPVQSFQNYVVPAAQALSGAPPVGPGNMSVVGGQGIVAFDSLGAAPPGYGNAMGINQPTQVASAPPVGPGNMSVVGGQGSVAFDSLGASPPGVGNATGINQPTQTASAAPPRSIMGGRGVLAFSSQGAAPPGMSNAKGITDPSQSTYQVADNEPAYTPSTQPVYTPDYSNDGLMDLPDPAAPTDQYVPPILPGQEGPPPGAGPTDYAGRGNDTYAYNVPAPQPPVPPIVPEPEDPDKDGLGWMRYYPNQYATQSQTVALPELTYMRDPASTGVGSLLPNIQVTPYRTI